jgi:hypothetical protein
VVVDNKFGGRGGSSPRAEEAAVEWPNSARGASEWLGSREKEEMMEREGKRRGFGAQGGA